jgi:uncharacterized protein YkwD
MNYLDIFLLIILLLCTWSGTRSGFIPATLDLITWLGSLTIAFITYPRLSNFLLLQFPDLGSWMPLLSFFIVALVSRALLNAVAGRFLRALSPEVHSNDLNRFLGVLPGAVNGLILVSFIAVFLMLIPLSSEISVQANESELSKRLIVGVEFVEEKISPLIEEPLARLTAKITDKGEHESIRLPYRVSRYRTRPELEAKMLDMLNKERSERGLKILKPDTALRSVARAYSVEMFTEGYFAHVSPDGGTLEDRLRERKVRYLLAGENLALAQTVSMAHTGLMNSPGHRANILNPAYGRIGIGIIDGGIYGLMVTQNFRN